jgi:integrase/recombinase XerD
MATLRIILHPLNKDSEGKRSIVLRFTLNRCRYYIDLGIKYRIFSTQFDEAGQIKPTSGIKQYKQVNAFIRERLEHAHDVLFQLERRNIPITYNRFKEMFLSVTKNDFVFPFFEEVISEMERKGEVGNAGIYKTVKNSVENFSRKKNLKFTDIDTRFLGDFAFHLQNKEKNPLTGNGVSLYMRTIRSLFNKAIAQKIVDGSFYPFYNNTNPSGYKATQAETRTRKKAISSSDIKLLEKYPTTPYTPIHDAKMYFLFSFYCRGINFTDMANLVLSNIENGRLIYTRAKTRNTQLLNLELLEPAKSIIEYFGTHPNTTDHIFPILNSKIHADPKKKKSRIQSILKDANRNLKIIANELGIDAGLSTNYARHTWATIMKQKGVSTAMISEGLAHTSEKTTQIYLDSFGNSELDKASRSILD